MPTLRELSADVAARRIGSHELVSESLRRIEKLDPDLGAVVALRAEEALDEAKGLDATIAKRDEAGPLAGLPLLVKDMTDVAGMRTAFGSLVFAEAEPATSDALVVARLRAAGAIVVGKTNMPEFAADGFTSNLVFGPTRNPWNPSRTPGGSSGGSGAAIAAGMAGIATATDGGGSIRIPAAYCGLFGLKPTTGVIGRDPIPDWIDYSTDGPLTARADDLRVLLDVLAGPTPGDPTATTWRPDGSSTIGRVVSVEQWEPDASLPPETATVFAAALARFAQIFGIEPRPVRPSDVFGDMNPEDDWITVVGFEHANTFGRWWFEEHRPLLSPSGLSFMEGGLLVSPEGYIAARRRRFMATRVLDELLGSDGLLLSPVMASDAIPAEGPQEGMTSNDLYVTTLQNITGSPALSLPAGAFPSGVRFGLQVTAPRFRDDLLLAIAELWEEAEGPPPTPPGYEAFGV
jgi:Asp-tRNA(Asn)/Glu-tRNA(Gln) amidotransferase A subunit family amidase